MVWGIIEYLSINKLNTHILTIYMYTTTKSMALKITERTENIGFQYENEKLKLTGALSISAGAIANISTSLHTIEDEYLGTFNEYADGALSVNIRNQALINEAVQLYELARIEIIKEVK